MKWTSTENGGTHTATADLVAAADEAGPSPDLALATTVADQAQLPRLQSRSRIGPSTWTCSRSSPRPSALSELVTVIGQAPGAH